MSYALQYRDAFAAIGGPDVEKLMCMYLPDAGYCGFGETAAWVLKDLSEKTHGAQPRKTAVQRSEFAGVNARRAERISGSQATSSAAGEICRAIEASCAPDAGQEQHSHALILARPAFLMLHGGKAALTSTLLQLPAPWSYKLPLLKVLAVTGDTLEIEMLMAGLAELLEEAQEKTKRWMLEENSGRLDAWLELFPFSNNPTGLPNVIGSIGAELATPHRLRRVVAALGHGLSPGSEQTLFELSRRDPRFLTDHAWLNALETHDSIESAQGLLELFVDGTLQLGASPGADTFARKLASGIRRHSEFRSQVYDRYKGLPTGQARMLWRLRLQKRPIQKALCL